MCNVVSTCVKEIYSRTVSCCTGRFIKTQNIHLLHLAHNISMPSNKTVNAVVNLGVVVPHLQETTVLLLALLLPSTSS